MESLLLMPAQPQAQKWANLLWLDECGLSQTRATVLRFDGAHAIAQVQRISRLPLPSSFACLLQNRKNSDFEWLTVGKLSSIFQNNPAPGNLIAIPGNPSDRKQPILGKARSVLRNWPQNSQKREGLGKGPKYFLDHSCSGKLATVR